MCGRVGVILMSVGVSCLICVDMSWMILSVCGGF